jgi:hypothetical protein
MKSTGIGASDWNKVGGVVSYQVVGLSDTLRALKLFEPELYNKLRRDLVKDAVPLANEIGGKFPAKPLRWWKESGRAGNARMPGYKASRAQAKVKPIAGTGREHGKGRAILRLQQMDGGGQVYDSAGGMRAKSQFVQNLDKHSRVKSRGGRFRSRILFPYTKKNQPIIQGLVADVVQELEKQTTRRLQGQLGAIGRKKF